VESAEQAQDRRDADHVGVRHKSEEKRIRRHNEMKRSVIAVAVVAAALFLASGAAVATDFVCITTSSGGTWHNVVVPAGANCILENTRVTGNVTVQVGSSLQVTNFAGDSTINGDVNADGCSFVELESTSLTHRIVVGGNVTIQNCSSGFNGGQGDSSRVRPGSILIGGNVKCSNNADGCVFDYFNISANLECSGNSFGCTVNSNAIGKNVTINNNQGVGVIIDNSAIGGDVKCSGNAFATAPTPDTIAGTNSGQCSAF
jgi:hypothetical protein